MRRLTLAALCLLASAAAAERPQLGILPLDPRSAERTASIDTLRDKGPALAKAFKAHVFRNQKGEQMPYRLFTPSHLEPGRRYPLVVFLHGAGGGGTDNLRQLQSANMFGALVWTLPENQERHPAFVLAPQSDVNWACTIYDPQNPPKTLADMKWCPPEALGLGAGLAFQVIDDLLGTLPVDRARIYVTGHSMGGAGAWHMIAQRPRFFAAAVPVCGHPLVATAEATKNVPIWNFHGVADDIEPVTTSRLMIDTLRKVGSAPRHTEYAGVGHNVFMWAYTEPALIEWLFAQKLRGR